MKNRLFTLLLFSALFGNLQSQIAGSFTVPGSFPTVAAAINTLNFTGVAGAVTINVIAGHTETVPVGGLKLFNPPGSTTTTILFKKQGSGSNPLLVAYGGGTAVSSSNMRDGIWMLVDCQNITIDGIDLIDLNTSSPSTMEFGYGFYKSANNGSRYNTIRNCSISLGVPNSLSSRAIEMSCNHYSINTTAVIPSSTLYANSYNTFHNNLIQKCDVGIWIVGNSSPTYIDYGNDIGGTSAVSGNTFVNYGGTPAGQAIHTEYQMQMNASFNIINNNTGTSATAVSGVEGIFAYSADATINSNTISLNCSGSTSQPLIGIRHVGQGGGTGTVNINNNIFPILSYTSPSVFGGSSHSIISTANNNVVYVNNNQIGNFTSNSGTINLITATSSYTTFINNNSISGATISTHGVIRGITASSEQPHINSNIISNFLAPRTSTSVSASVIGIYVPAGTASLAVSGNTLMNYYGSDLSGMSFASTVSAATFSITNNSIANFSIAPTTTLGCVARGIGANLPSTSGTMTIRSNTIANLIGTGYGTNNGQGSISGIVGGTGAKAYVSQNKVYDLSTSGTGQLQGIWVNTADSYIFNNLVGGLQAPGSNVEGLSLNVGNHRLYYNTICLSNTATPSGNSGTNLITAINSASLELRNNILVNTSAATGTGVTSIILVNNLTSTSNNNAYYFGTPGPSRRLSGSVPSTSVLSGFQSTYSSDAQSFIENPTFASTTGSSANFLNINSSIATQIEGGAATISTITTDFINTVRSSTPDVGAWEGNYTAADLTAPTLVNSGFAGPPCNSGSRTFTVNITDVSGVASGSLSPRLYYRVNFGLYTSTQGILSSGTATNGTWSFVLSYTANSGDVIWYFLVLQDISYLNNVSIIPATGATVTNVNNVAVPPNPASSYTIQAFPTISVAVTSATVCASHPFVIQASGASSYSYLPGTSATVVPVANTIYSVSGESSQGCPSTNTISVNLTVITIPTITVNSGSICVGQTFTMIPNGAIYYTYQGGSPVVSPLSTTIYTVLGSITPTGCTSLPAVSTVSVYAANIGVISSTTQVCNGGNVVLSGSGGLAYTWSGSVINGVPFAPVATAIYTVSANSANGCAGTKTIQVIVYPLPTLSLSASTNTVCEGEIISVTASGALNYTWQPSSQVGSVYTNTLLSTLTLSVDGSDIHGCISSANILLVADACVGIPELKTGTFRVFPNPSNGNFHICNDAEIKGIFLRVTDINGRQILHSELSNALSQIDLSHSANGVYIIEIYKEDLIISRSKIILTNNP